MNKKLRLSDNGKTHEKINLMRKMSKITNVKVFHIRSKRYRRMQILELTTISIKSRQFYGIFY